MPGISALSVTLLNLRFTKIYNCNEIRLCSAPVPEGLLPSAGQWRGQSQLMAGELGRHLDPSRCRWAAVTPLPVPAAPRELPWAFLCRVLILPSARQQSGVWVGGMGLPGGKSSSTAYFSPSPDTEHCPRLRPGRCRCLARISLSNLASLN